MNGYNPQQHGCFPLVFIYDNDDDGWAPVITYRGLPPIPGDKITIAEQWMDIKGEASRQEVEHFIVISRHFIISKTYGVSCTERQKFEIGVEKANVSRMTIERKEDG